MRVFINLQICIILIATYFICSSANIDKLDKSVFVSLYQQFVFMLSVEDSILDGIRGIVYII